MPVFFHQLTLHHQELMRIQKERDDYSDQHAAEKDGTDLVAQARRERDAAIAR